MTADLPATAAFLQARDLFLSFGSTPALRGASLPEDGFDGPLFGHRGE